MLGGPVAKPDRDYSKETPVATPVFEAYRRFYAYDRTPVVASAPTVQDDHPDWRIETVTFPAVYGNETVIARVYLPKRRTPPFQTLVLGTGSSQFGMKSSLQEVEERAAAVVRSGRAIVMPIIKGAFERSSDRSRRSPLVRARSGASTSSPTRRTCFERSTTWTRGQTSTTITWGISATAVAPRWRPSSWRSSRRV